MEHLPLILFTTLLAASAGLFSTQAVYAMQGKGQKAQMPALGISAALLVLGGIAVFLHLQHWERIFNGFGHITSGITQELIAIVLMVIMMVICFALIRKDTLPKWCSVMMIVVSAILVLVMGLSYMMAAHPTWNSLFQVLSLYGVGIAAGAGIFLFLDAPEGKAEGEAGKDAELTAKIAQYATYIFAILTVLFIAAMTFAGGSFVDVGYYFDPNHPTKAMMSGMSYSPFGGNTLWLTLGAIIFAGGSVASAMYGKKSGMWKNAGIGIAVCAIIGGILLRSVFFATGGSVFMFY